MNYIDQQSTAEVCLEHASPLYAALRLSKAAFLCLYERVFLMFSINGLISEGANTEPNDVLKTKTALAQTGHYKVPSHGIVPFPDRQMIDGLKNFQRDNGLTVDGVMRPKGPTDSFRYDTSCCLGKGRRKLMEWSI